MFIKNEIDNFKTYLYILSSQFIAQFAMPHSTSPRVRGLDNPWNSYHRQGRCPPPLSTRKLGIKKKSKKKKHTTVGIRWWSPTQLLIHRSEACVWQSGRDAQFSSVYGRMCLIRRRTKIYCQRSCGNLDG